MNSFKVEDLVNVATIEILLVHLIKWPHLLYSGYGVE